MIVFGVPVVPTLIISSAGGASTATGAAGAALSSAPHATARPALGWTLPVTMT